MTDRTYDELLADGTAMGMTPTEARDYADSYEEPQTTCAMCNAELGGTSEEFGGLCDGCNIDSDPEGDAERRHFDSYYQYQEDLAGDPMEMEDSFYD
jgi:hypothetical protein